MRIIVHIYPVSCNETVLENYAFLVYVYNTHPGYQTSIFGKNRAYYIRIITVSKLNEEASGDRPHPMPITRSIGEEADTYRDH